MIDLLWQVPLFWLAGFVLVMVLVAIALKTEPTAHGQIAGRQIGCVIAVVWPIAVPFLVIVALHHFVRKYWRYLKHRVRS